MIRTFIRTEPRKPVVLPQWEEELLAKIYEYWPRCTELMTNATASVIYNAVGIKFPDGAQQIKATYRRRKYSQNITLRTADFVKGFTPAEETLLELMYQYWPRRIATLTPTCKEILMTAIGPRPEFHDLGVSLDFVFKHRKFRRGYFELPNKPGMTEEEETIIDKIYKNWPHNTSNMNKKTAASLSRELKLPIETIKDSFKYRKWSRKPYLRGSMSPRARAALVRLDLLRYYIEQGDDINVQDNNGLTLLMLAAQDTSDSMNYLLTQPTIDPTLTNNNGQNVLIYVSTLWSSVVGKMKILLQWNKVNGHLIDINSVDNDRKSMLYYACDNNRLPTIELLIKEPTLRINQKFSGKTILMNFCEQQRNAVVAILLTHPNIDVSDTISVIYDHSLKNTMIRKQIANQSSSGSSSSSSTTVETTEGCGHYSLNQGRSGICYILSVITLFRNAPEILEELKSTTSEIAIVKLLTDDYSTYDFSNRCPNLPPGMIQAITNNRVTRTGALTKNGGSAFTLLMYILNIIDAKTVIDVGIYHDDRHQMSETTMTETIQNTHQRFITSQNRLGLIDLGTDILLLPTFFTNLRLLMNECLDISGFIFRVYGSGVDHVVAAGVCQDRSIHICNSWGKGCQTDFSEFVNDITDWGEKPLMIKNIAFLLYKRL
jgi:ankyrin repeat protein